MEVQILVSTMDQVDYSLLDKLNIQSNAVVINQCGREASEVLEYNGFKIEWISVNERGLSRSRNLALTKSSGDICLLVDDDERLKDGYPITIENAFRSYPDASIIAFNIDSIGGISNRYYNKKNKRLHRYNSMRYGSARIAFLRENVIRAGIEFPILFGAGATYSSGEDSIFLSRCFEKKMKIYACTGVIADIVDEDGTSSWFTGYNRKYFMDKGSVYAAMSQKSSFVFSLYFAIKHRKKFKGTVTVSQAIIWMFEGRTTYIKNENP